MTGLTSVTFRDLTVSEIVQLAVKAGLDGIEWGGDIHAPAGDTDTARKIKEETLNAGLRVFSYGSYYRLSGNAGWKDELTAVLKTAAALEAPIIRIWAGGKGSAETPPQLRDVLTQNLRDSCRLAEEYGLQLALEYHRNTITDTAESTLELLGQADCSNLSTYWQPNPDLSYDTHFQEINTLLPYISNIHVFNWEKGNVRLPLGEGGEVWEKYIQLLGTGRDYIMEFVKDDSQTQFIQDAESLIDLVKS